MAPVSTVGGELNVAYNGSLSMYSEADETFAQRDHLGHTVQPFVSLFDRLTLLKLEGTHRVRTHAELLYPNPNLDLCPFNPKTMSFLGYPKVIHYLYRLNKFEHFGIIRFFYLCSEYYCEKMHLLTLWPWRLTFQPQNHVISTTSQYQVWTV